MSEVKKELPQGWASAEFSEICHLISDNGKKIKQKNYLNEGTYPVIDQGEKEIAGFSNDHSLVFDGDFPIVAFGDHTRRFKKISKKFVVGADGVKLFTPDTKLNFDYILNQLRISKFENRGYSRHFQFIRKLDFKIAPLAEQSRIVDKIDELFSSIEAGERAIARARTALTRYRKAVLKAAVTGELTADWRAKNPPSETAQDLLARILKARYNAWEKAELEKLDVKGTARPETDKQWEKFRARYKEPAEPLVEFELMFPNTWRQASVEELTSAVRVISYGVLQPGENLNEGIKLVRVCDVKNSQINQEKLKVIDPNIAKKYQRTFLKGGELLVTLVGSVGRTAIVPPTLAGANVARAVGVLSVTDLIQTRWLELCLIEEKSNQNLIGSSREVARKTLNLEQLRSFPAPLPSVEEQIEIVSRVEQALSKVDKAEATLSAQAKQAKALKQAVLKAAFEGRLVPQDPNDEPASELLKRIKAAS